MEELVSVIVPVYNVEKYLKRCVDSVINQTYTKLQIILVDDKSTDSSGKMCDIMAGKDGRIQVVHKTVNEGLGMARNTGIEYIKGKYVLFIDSDDYIDPMLCQKAVSRLSETQADICFFGSKRDANGQISGSNIISMKELYEGEDIIDEFLVDTIAQSEKDSGAPKIGMSAWRILYKSDLFSEYNLKFYSERDYLNEDLFFRVALVKCIRKIAVIREDLYYYCFNGASLTMKYRQDRFEASKRMYKKLREETSFCRSQIIDNRCRRAFMNNLLVCIRQEVRFEKERNIDVFAKLNVYCSDMMVQRVLEEYPIRCMPIQPRLLYVAIKMKWIHIVKFLVFLKGYSIK